MAQPDPGTAAAGCHSREGGFSLLEVLAAFVVLALVMTVLLRLIGTHARSSALSADYAEATRHAETVLAGSGLDVDLYPGTSEGTVEDRWRWRRVVTIYEEPGRDFSAHSGFQPLRVDVEVAWIRDGRERSVSLSTVRLAKTR
jgi:general secretion pathway protein I